MVTWIKLFYTVVKLSITYFVIYKQNIDITINYLTLCHN